MNTQKTLAQLVDENFVYASVLFHFGIPFFDLPHLSLQETCRLYGVSESRMMKMLEQTVRDRNASKEAGLLQYPAGLIIAYLQHAHHIFIKQRLPYLGQLIGNLDDRCGAAPDLVQDLKFVFPLFAEDFIHHIYEEEDTLFTYIRSLEDFKEGKGSRSQMYYQLEQYSIQDFAVEHLVEDDEMAGIRRITQGYALQPEHGQLLRVVYQELQAFEHELTVHARVENEILFPKALTLECQARAQWQGTISQN